MSGPGSDVSAELGDYLEQKGVNALFLELVEYLLAERPSNPVQFVLSHLVRHYPDMCQIPRVIGFETEEVKYDRTEKEEEEDEDEEERRDKPIHRRSRRRRGAVSAPSIEPEDIGKHFRRRRVPKSAEDIATIKRYLRTFHMFESIPEEELHQLVMAMTPSSPEKGKVLYTQGQQDSKALYLVMSGQVNLHQTKPSRELETVMPVRVGQCFGTHQAFYEFPREHTAKAATDDVKLWVLDRDTLKLTVMEEIQTVRKRRVAFLINVPVLGMLAFGRVVALSGRRFHPAHPAVCRVTATLTDLERLTLADSLEVEDYADGEVVLRQNDPGRHMYIVETGFVVITQQASPVAAPVELCRLGPGAYFGEMALLTDRPRTASAAASGDARLLALNRTTLRRILGPFSDILKRDKGLYNAFMAQKL